MQRLRQHLLWRTMILMFAVTGALIALSSCGKDDEPQTIGYYLDVEEEFLVNGSEDHTDRYYSPVTLMKEAIQTAYPKPNVNGDDDKVIAACDELYQRYISMYTGKAEHLTCLIHLMRANLDGEIVRQSEIIRTYQFDINPYEVEE